MSPNKYETNPENIVANLASTDLILDFTLIKKNVIN